MKSLFENKKSSKNNQVKNQIIEYFIVNGNATNADLAKEFNLSVPTIVKIVNEMCDEGLSLIHI